MTGMSADSIRSQMADAQLSSLMKRPSTSPTGTLGGPTQGAKEDAKIQKAGTDFESILLGSWLQKAEQSFATVPGGDEDEDDDGGKDQFQGMAMQSLAGSLTASGGIGIAKMITTSLHAAAERESPKDGQK